MNHRFDSVEGRDVNRIRFVESRMNLGFALTLPVLVAMSCFFPLLYLTLGLSLTWLAASILVVAAFGVCSILLRDYGGARAVAVSAYGVGAGSATFIALIGGLMLLGASEDAGVYRLMLSIVGLTPWVLIVLAVLALVLQYRALPLDRIVLCVVWAIAFATPFVISSPIAAMSARAGNFGWDVLALFVMPLSAFLIWAFMLQVVLVFPEGSTWRRLTRASTRTARLVR